MPAWRIGRSWEREERRDRYRGEEEAEPHVSVADLRIVDGRRQPR